MRDPQGLPLYRFGYFQDITSQKRAEEDIHSVVTQARCILWRATVTGVDDWTKYERGKVKFDWDFKVQDNFAAQNFQPLLIPPGGGYSDAWIASRHPEDRSRMDEVSAKALIKGLPSYSQIFRSFDKFGDTMWIREEVAVSPLGPGKWRCIGVCMDATDEHRLNEQLRQQTELLELSHDAIIARNDSGEILFWRQRRGGPLRMASRGGPGGKNIHEILATPNAPEEFEKSLREQGYWAGNLRHTAKDGREILVGSRHLVVLRPDGRKIVLETNHNLSSQWSGAVNDSYAS